MRNWEKMHVYVNVFTLEILHSTFLCVSENVQLALELVYGIGPLVGL